MGCSAGLKIQGFRPAARTLAVNGTAMSQTTEANIVTSRPRYTGKQRPLTYIFIYTQNLTVVLKYNDDYLI